MDGNLGTLGAKMGTNLGTLDAKLGTLGPMLDTLGVGPEPYMATWSI